MDRRIVSGIVGALLASAGGSAHAQSVPARDPSNQSSVGLLPIRSISDSINDVSTIPNGVPVASGRVPTSPLNSGPAAAIPNPPALGDPVSMTPIDPLQHSLTHGFGSGRIASLFRKPGERPTAPPARTTPSRFLPSYNTMMAPPTFSPLTPAPAPPSAPRPSPYATQAPDNARPQAEPTGPGEARPSPYAREAAPSPRPQSPAVETPGYRPAETPAPRPVETELPALPVDRPAGPVVLPEPPPLGPVSATVAPEPVPAPSAPTVGVIEPMTGDLPELSKPEPTAAPSVAAVEPPPGLPPLETIQTLATPIVQAKAEPEPMVDDQVRQTNGDNPAMQLKDDRTRRKINYITFRAAAVGNEIITITELQDAVKLQMAELTSGQQIEKDSPEFKTLMNRVAVPTLERLIDQRLLLQEAKSKLGKNWEPFNNFIDGIWKTDELAPMHRKYGTNNVHELKIKLRDEGKNYDAMKEAFQKKEMATQFLKGEIRNFVTCDKPEQMAYYNAHLNEFMRPARMTWREIEINISRYPDRATARRKADEVLARLLHNESFETIAKTVSNGPTASQGGVYVDMQPGSYGIASVNEELNRIPVGRVSQVIEAPGAFFIIRVDSRREKGPLHFVEVQNEIKNQVLMENYQKAVTQYLAKLRSKYLVRTMFESTKDGLVAAGDPTKSDPAVQPAANR